MESAMLGNWGILNRMHSPKYMTNECVKEPELKYLWEGEKSAETA